MLPDAGDGAPAVGAMVGLQAVCSDRVAVALDEEAAAAGAVRVLEIADPPGEVSRVDELEALLLPDGGRPDQSRHGSVVRVGHLVVLVERGDVPRDFGRDR